ncbi:MAG TPA: ThuA domain-containing protein [Opitutaceae bacterium]
MKSLLAVLLAVGVVGSALAASAPKRVLLVTTTTGFRHSSIPLGEKVIRELAAKSGEFTIVSTSESPDYPTYPEPGKQGGTGPALDAQVAKVLAPLMNAQALKSYDAIILLSTVGQLPLPDADAFFKWVADGGAIVGVHAATDSLHGTPAYAQMMGGAFDYHGKQAMGEVVTVDTGHAAAAGWGASRSLHEEWYIFKLYDRSRVRSVLSMNRRPDDGRGEAGAAGHFPVSWARSQGKGRIFYTSLGHREDIWDPVATPPGTTTRMNSPEIAQAFQAHLLGGIRWALGLAPGESIPQPE